MSCYTIATADSSIELFNSSGSETVARKAMLVSALKTPLLANAKTR
jgi:hypothetical protein